MYLPGPTAWPTTTTSARRAPSSSGRCSACTRRTRAADSGVREPRIPEGDRSIPATGARSASQRPVRRPAPTTSGRSGSTDGRTRSCRSTTAASASGASLDWTLGTAPTSWGSAPQDAPPSYTDGLRPVVGYLSDQSVTIAPGSSATVQVGAQNATANGAERARRHLGSGRKRPVRVAVERHDLGLA